MKNLKFKFIGVLFFIIFLCQILSASEKDKICTFELKEIEKESSLGYSNEILNDNYSDVKNEISNNSKTLIQIDLSNLNSEEYDVNQKWLKF